MSIFHITLYKLTPEPMQTNVMLNFIHLKFSLNAFRHRGIEYLGTNGVKSGADLLQIIRLLGRAI